MKNHILLLAASSTLLACSQHAPMQTVDYVDLDRFMGDWYVVANIPTLFEEDAHNAVESYRLNDDGSVATRFTFRDGGFDGRPREYNPTGYILDTRTNARWGMQFLWPIKADYRIVYLDEGYTRTVIGRAARDYVWVMQRSPDLSGEEYEEIVSFIDSIGYDTSKMNRVPHSWPGQAGNAAGERIQP